MENIWHLFNNNTNTNDGGRGQNTHSTTNSLSNHLWDLGNIATPYSTTNATSTTTATANTVHYFQEGGFYGTMFPHNPSSRESGGSSYFQPDPHLASLNLGKRHYFENANNNYNNNLVAINKQQESEVIIKKVKNLVNGQEQFSEGDFGDGNGGYESLIWQSPSPSPSTSSTSVALPRCQVEGCNVMLMNAKDYHKRHKVCENHSKAPKVTVLGIEQRFCQQCSRFHAISEFDDLKRSCRRRLAGHNERRRKSSQDQPAPRNLASDKVMAGGCGYLPLLSSGNALSLLSTNNNHYNSSPDLSEQSSAALRELIVENRAAVSAWNVDRSRHSWRNHAMEDQTMLQNHRINCFPASETGYWEDLNAGAHLSLERQANSKFSI